MQFEFDNLKSERNKEKHGIDFIEAQHLWDRDVRMAPTISVKESRWAVTGTIDGICWTAIVTFRGENIRIISVRRARRNEREKYGQE